MIMNGVSDALTTDELNNLRDFINNGGNLLVAQGRVDVALNQQIVFFQGTNVQSNIFDLLNEYGVTIEENLLLDKQNGQINIPQQVSNMLLPSLIISISLLAPDFVLNKFYELVFAC